MLEVVVFQDLRTRRSFITCDPVPVGADHVRAFVISTDAPGAPIGETRLFLLRQFSWNDGLYDTQTHHLELVGAQVSMLFGDRKKTARRRNNRLVSLKWGLGKVKETLCALIPFRRKRP